MLISHDYQFIFIKTHKTGGTSLEIALSRFLGPDDVITPISREDEAYRRSLGYRGPQNHKVPDLPLAERLVLSIANLAGRGLSRTMRFYNHMPAGEVRAKVGEEVWNNYTKFCVERNPYSKVVSAFWWRARFGERAFRDYSPITDSLGMQGKFEEFVLSGRARVFSDFHLYSEGGQVAVDRVLNYDNLSEELNALASDIGLPEEVDISRSHVNAKGTHRRPDRVVLTPAIINAIDRDFWREIQHFGYMAPLEHSAG